MHTIKNLSLAYVKRRFQIYMEMREVFKSFSKYIVCRRFFEGRKKMSKVQVFKYFNDKQFGDISNMQIF